MGQAKAISLPKARQRKLLLALLRKMRHEAGVRQTELAAALGKPQSFVSKYESGERRLDLLELREVCRALGVPLTEFARRLDDALR